MSKKKQVALTTRGHHAIMAMLELHRNQNGNTPVPLSNIAKSADISLSYLEQLFACLRRHKLVKSHRGPGGGYLLAAPASDILISSVLSAVENCLPGQQRSQDKFYSLARTNKLWSNIGELLYIYLQHVSLADVAENSILGPDTLVAKA